MANFNNLTLTTKGMRALMDAQTGITLTLSKIGLGSGKPASGASVSDLVKAELMLPISETKKNSDTGLLTIVAKMTNEDIEEGFYWRETGLFFEDADGSDVLFAYASVDNQYDYVPAYSDHRYVKHIRIANIVTDSANIVINEQQGLLYVDVLTFAEHTDNKENPHGVTHEQLGGTAPANTVFAGPTDSEGKPTFRKLVADDFPGDYNAPTASAIKTTSLGNMEGKTIPELKTLLKNWVETVARNGEKCNACATFSCAASFATLWNSEDTATKLSPGSLWFARLTAGAATDSFFYFMLEISTYRSNYVYHVALSDNSWERISKVAFDNDLATKAPAGYVSRSVVTSNETALNNALSEVYATMQNRTAEFIVIVSDDASFLEGFRYLCELYRVDKDYGTAKFTTYGASEAKVYSKSLYGGNWTPLVNCSPSAFAPSGYGYGGSAIYLKSSMTMNEDELDSALEAVYSAMANGETKLVRFYGYPSNSDYVWFGFLFKSSTNYGSLMVHSTYVQGSLLTKTKYNGVWEPLEWENPPMVLGVEYRTTERWKGKPVYTKAINFGVLPNNTTSYVNNVIPEKVNVIHMYGFGKSSVGSVVNIDKMSGVSLYWAVDDYIAVKSTDDRSDYTATFVVKYTKD